MKIVDTDNLGGDYPDEKVIAEGITNKEFADAMAEALNEKYCHNGHGSRYYRAVEDDYQLQPGFEP